MMGRDSRVEVYVLVGVLWLAWSLRRERRLSVATLLVLPAIMLAFILAQRERLVGAGGTPGALAALAGVLAGLVVATRSCVRVEPATGTVVVRGTPASLLLWPGMLALYALGRRAALWLRAEEVPGRLDGPFLMFIVALVLAERGWLYHAYRRAAAPTGR